MAHTPRVVIILGRCERTEGLFGIRFEEAGRGSWAGDWAFNVPERTAKRERYDESEIAGSFSFAPGYPGCPGCGGSSLFRCTCGKVACWDGESPQVRCPWCGQTGTLNGVVDSLSTGRDL